MKTKLIPLLLLVTVFAFICLPNVKALEGTHCRNLGFCVLWTSCKTWGGLTCQSVEDSCSEGFGDCGCCDTMEGDNWPCRCNW